MKYIFAFQVTGARNYECCHNDKVWKDDMTAKGLRKVFGEYRANIFFKKFEIRSQRSRNFQINSTKRFNWFILAKRKQIC